MSGNNQGIEVVYNNRRYRAIGEAMWACFFDIIGIIFGYEVKNISGWLVDFYFSYIPGLCIDGFIEKKIACERKAAEYDNDAQFTPYLSYVYERGDPILFIGHIPGFAKYKMCKYNKIHFATAVNPRTGERTKLYIGYNLDKENIFGLYSNNDKVVKCTGEYKPIDRSDISIGLKMLVDDAKIIIDKFCRKGKTGQTSRYFGKIRYSYNEIKKLLLLKRSGKKIHIKNVFRYPDLNIKTLFDAEYEELKGKLVESCIDVFDNECYWKDCCTLSSTECVSRICYAKRNQLGSFVALMNQYNKKIEKCGFIHGCFYCRFKGGYACKNKIEDAEKYIRISKKTNPCIYVSVCKKLLQCDPNKCVQYHNNCDDIKHVKSSPCIMGSNMFACDFCRIYSNCNCDLKRDIFG